MIPSVFSVAVPGSTATGAPAHVNAVQMFLDADIVVQLVMAGLLLASVAVWAIIIGFSLKMSRVEAHDRKFEKAFWRADDVERVVGGEGRQVPSRRIAAAGLAEWRRSSDGPIADRDGLRHRIAVALDGAVTAESDRLAEQLNFLATVGSVAPFVGLFGTVWGIMNSFFQIGAQANTSLAVVAPGISEALFATALGLFAAIPAVIAYNRFSFRLNRFEARLYRFSDRFQSSLSREMERS